MGLKVSDGLIAALCWREHSRIDSGRDLSRDERRALMDAYIRRTFRRAELRGDVPPALLQRWRSELERAGLLGVAA